MYVVCNINGNLLNFLQWQRENGINNNEIILGGNFIGRDDGIDMLDYLMKYGTSFAAVLRGRYENSFINWDYNCGKRHPYLFDSWFYQGYKGITSQWMEDALMYIELLPSFTCVNRGNITVDALAENKQTNNIPFPSCGVFANDMWTFLPDDRNGMSIYELDASVFPQKR